MEVENSCNKGRARNVDNQDLDIARMKLDKKFMTLFFWMAGQDMIG